MGIHIGIVGGGIAGLVAGYELAKNGAQVTILEREGCLGGLASPFAVGPDQEIERYYHFICKPDTAYSELLRELGLASRLRWKVTRMGVFYRGAVHSIGDPLSLLRFPHLSVGDKIRLAWSTAMIKTRNSQGWKALEDVRAREWLVRRYGQRTYNVLYAPLVDLKFHEYAPRISAAWMWARFHRLGNSRTITQREYVGYLDGGTQVYIDALAGALRERGADVRTATPVERVVVENGHLVGLQCDGEVLRFDCVLSTVPVPHVAQGLLSDVRGPYFDGLRQLEYIDVRVMVMRLRQRFSTYFWMNIGDPEINLPGIIEYTNLNSCPDLGGDAILYLPQYLSVSHPLYNVADQDLFDLYCKYLHQINPAFEANWVRDYWVHRDRFAQPICDLSFSERIPSIQTPIESLYMTDSYQLHPDDRTVCGSTDLGREAARLILNRR